MRGEETQAGVAFSYASVAERVPSDHPLKAIRRMTEELREQMGPAFDLVRVRTLEAVTRGGSFAQPRFLELVRHLGRASKRPPTAIQPIAAAT